MAMGIQLAAAMLGPGYLLRGWKKILYVYVTNWKKTNYSAFS
jgi:hypothetical protein